jgi:integrase/recombinase XerD
MDLAYTSTPAGSAVRHAHIIAAWQLAQSSRHTLTAFTRNLAVYCAWLDRVGLDLLSVHVDGYRHTLTGVPSTLAVKLSALSSFYRYALSEGVVDRNPVATVVRPNVDADHSSTQGLSRDQAKALLEVARRDGPRSNALINLLMFTGVRISEALQARTSDYGHDAGHRTLSIRRRDGDLGGRGAQCVPRHLGS